MIYYAMPLNKYLLAKWILYNVNPFNFVLLVMQGKSQQSVYFIISCKCKITNHQYGLVHNPLYPFLFFYFLDNIYPPFSHQSTQSHVFIYIFACLDNNNKLRILFVLLSFQIFYFLLYFCSSACFILVSIYRKHVISTA